jgi:DnaJ-class molecular chaperone
MPIAAEAATTESRADPTRAECTPCRGSGQVSSMLGGEPATVQCPWCEGGGQFLPEHDAQAARRTQAVSA